MTARKPGAPIPPALRNTLHTPHHPARTIPCPHCHASTGTPCHLRTTGRHLPKPHPQRISNWAQQTAVCPHCQVTPGVPCHDAGRPRTTVHARRYQEAEETCA